MTECEIKVCDDPENEVYQECGSKCVLGCRYATTSSGFSLTISKHDCEKNDCVEGCFCKTGLVRHQTQCIPALECPVRRCNHRYEVYVSENLKLNQSDFWIFLYFCHIFH